MEDLGKLEASEKLTKALEDIQQIKGFVQGAERQAILSTERAIHAYRNAHEEMGLLAEQREIGQNAVAKNMQAVAKEELFLPIQENSIDGARLVLAAIQG